MLRARLLLPAALVLLVGLTGCGTARMIQSAPDGGIVAIPSNSNHWPFYYRDEAARLMALKCPNGYEIVEENEVVVGKTKTTRETVDHHNPTEKNGNHERTTTNLVTSISDQTEYRITFRARTPTVSAANDIPPVVNTRRPEAEGGPIIQAGSSGRQDATGR